MSTHPPSLAALIELLDPEGAKRFLAFAQPTIQQYQHDLLTSLQQQDWETAAAIAHRFTATAHLYSPAALAHQLDIISAKQLQTLQQADFLPRLMLEFQLLEESIAAFLKEP